MKKVVLLILTSLAIVGCSSNGMNGSIAEPMSSEDLKKNIEKDPDFENFYKITEACRLYFKFDEIAKAKYSGITYKDMIDFRDKVTDTAFINKFLTKEHKRYVKEYPSYDEKIDSIFNYWKEYYEPYDPDKYVSIKCTGEHSRRYVNYLIRNCLEVELTPLKERLNWVNYKYAFYEKGTTPTTNDWRETSYDDSFSKAVTDYIFSRNDEIDKDVAELTKDEFFNKYDYRIEVTDVGFGNTKLSHYHEDIPESVLYVLKLNKSSEINENQKTAIIKELIDPDYPSFKEYYDKPLNEMLKGLNADVYNFMTEIGGSYQNWNEKSEWEFDWENYLEDL